ncbi:hypothetical protein GE107_16970 [Cohnella sp. CFH 77786]|uniref:hypothetical protein n=1 Tax=Cohnella sp. CFH 77786 TaxID=2662265 RepID=UPI001C60B521|nr:hypothetical protein [Cohnella sp. CFH 77786]MBW5447749.1 hypothetical protein [Cohnella sp. CFH 77786]
MTIGRVARCLTVGIVLSIIGIGLLPFLLVFMLIDVNGLTEFDPTPIYTLVNKFIGGSKT